ncbi:MAG: DUF2818 family protein [Gammaproteobacteria bacterium]|nr:DUF2818 family protein [Gammaproteobacteria bacterium]
MGSSVAIWLLIVAAFLLANLPWFTEKLFALKSLKKEKAFSIRLMEWFALYFIIGTAALGLETKLNGVRHEQSWEFYVVTLCLFMVFALPGVIFQIDLKHHLRIKTE